MTPGDWLLDRCPSCGGNHTQPRGRGCARPDLGAKPAPEGDEPAAPAPEEGTQR